MQPDKFLIGILMVSLFITAGLFFMLGSGKDNENSLFKNYSDISDRASELVTGADNLTGKFGDIDSREGGVSTTEGMYNTTSEVRDELMSTEVVSSSAWENTVLGPYRVLQRFWGYIRLLGTMIENLGLLLNIPQIFTDFAMVAALIVVVFMIVYLILRFQPQS